jgi:hypothetical protein
MLTPFTGLPPDASHLAPGSFFLRKIEGWTGRWVSAGQAFIRGGSNWTHAGLILNDEQIIQAQPGGAVILPATDLWHHGSTLISDAPMQIWKSKQKFDSAAVADLTELGKRDEIVGKARYLEGVPYSILDYLAITMTELKIPGWKLVRARVEDSKHLICSALVDRAYSWADIHLFDDGRLPGDVTPFDLESYVLRYQGSRIARIAEAAGAPRTVLKGALP